MESEQQGNRSPSSDQAAHFTYEADDVAAPAWEEIDTGRYMPRRIKGSCKGRALG